ncbi:MAG TPA: hypothetical protein VD903_04390 [Pseudonocardia sp.]|nr:hypothetical protein [Pseudonocardia sp.]
MSRTDPPTTTHQGLRVAEPPRTGVMVRLISSAPRWRGEFGPVNGGFVMQNGTIGIDTIPGIFEVNVDNAYCDSP